MNLSTLLAISTVILVESVTDETRYPTFMPTHDDSTPSPTFAAPAPIFVPTPAPTLENELPSQSKPSFGGYSMNYYDILDNFSGKSSKASSGKSSKQASGKSAKRSSKSSKSRSKIDAKSDTETDVKVSSNVSTDSSGKSRKEGSKSSKSSISSSKSSGKSGKASSGMMKGEAMATEWSDSIDQSSKSSGKSGKSGNDTGVVNGGYGDYPPSYSYAVPTPAPIAFLTLSPTSTVARPTPNPSFEFLPFITPPPTSRLSTCSPKLLERCCRNPSSNSPPLQKRCKRKGCDCTK